MTKSKDKSEVEHLRGLVRELKSKNRNLEKELSRKGKREHRCENLEERERESYLEESSENQVIPNKNICPECSERPLQYIDIGIRYLISCEKCGPQGSKKK